MSTDLARVIRDHVDGTPVPTGDLRRARAQGAKIRRRRTAGAVAAAGVAVVAIAAVAVQVGGSDPRSEERIDPADRSGASEGLRYYGDIGDEVSIAGTKVSPGIATDLGDYGEPTPYGVVTYSFGVPMLVDQEGEVTPLVPGATRAPQLQVSVPGAGMDAQQPLVAFAATVEGERVVVVRNFETGADVATLRVADRTTIDALEDGVVFLHTTDGATVWDTGTGEEAVLAGPDTEVLDVRNGVLLHRGPAPAGPAAGDYRLVRVDSSDELTFDGRYVVGEDSTLVPTDGDTPLDLALPEDAYAANPFLDTDGSVLTTTYTRDGRGAGAVFDCAIPDGPCELLETFPAEG